jgi:hypothetical protein
MQSSTGIVLGRGNGTFRSCITSPNEVSPDALLAGDFNGDGHLDVAVVQAVGDRPPTFSGSITVLPGRGDGTFGTATTTATGSDVGGGVAGAVAGDFDGDGRLDVALAGPSTSVMLLGDGRGGFAVHVLSFRGAALASGDANGDGALDLAVLDPPRVAILLGRGDGRFSAANELDLATGAYASLAFGDVDGDGHLDLVLGGASAQVLLGAGDGTFAGAVGVGVFPGVTSNLGVADVNGDGRADVVYGGDGRLGVLLGSACTGK